MGVGIREKSFAVSEVTDFAVGRLSLVPNLCISEESTGKSYIAAAFSLEVATPGERPMISAPTLRAVRRLTTAFLHGDRGGSSIVCFKPVNYEAKYCLMVFKGLSSRSMLSLMLRVYSFVVKFRKRVPKTTPRRYNGCRRRGLSVTGCCVGGCGSTLMGSHRLMCPRWEGVGALGGKANS